METIDKITVKDYEEQILQEQILQEKIVYNQHFLKHKDEGLVPWKIHFENNKETILDKIRKAYKLMFV